MSSGLVFLIIKISHTPACFLPEITFKTSSCLSDRIIFKSQEQNKSETVGFWSWLSSQTCAVSQEVSILRLLKYFTASLVLMVVLLWFLMVKCHSDNVLVFPPPRHAAWAGDIVPTLSIHPSHCHENNTYNMLLLVLKNELIRLDFRGQRSYPCDTLMDPLYKLSVGLKDKMVIYWSHLEFSSSLWPQVFGWGSSGPKI